MSVASSGLKARRVSKASGVLRFGGNSALASSTRPARANRSAARGGLIRRHRRALGGELI
jgi:hypothetical protein